MLGPDLIHETGFLTAEDGTQLFCQGLAPRAGFRAAVALLHGYNSFSDWSLPMMAALARHGLACSAIDYRGHGLSDGLQLHVFSFREYLADAGALCRHVAQQADGRPLFALGNSLGGLILSHYVLHHPDTLQGVILTAPFFGPAFHVPPLAALFASVTGLCRPTQRIPRHHPDLPEYITYRWWVETTRAQQWFRRRAAQFNVPVLVLHGEEDRIACPRTAAELVGRFAVTDRTFRLLPGCGHCELDPCRSEGWRDEVRDWILQRAGTARPGCASIYLGAPSTRHYNLTAVMAASREESPRGREQLPGSR